MASYDMASTFHQSLVPGEQQEWHRLDDHSVLPVSRREVFDESAYMLFYERCDGELPPRRRCQIGAATRSRPRPRRPR